MRKEILKGSKKVEDNQVEYMGDLFEDCKQMKLTPLEKINFLKYDIKTFFHDFKFACRNNLKWFRIISELRPWEGFSGVLKLTKFHLEDYLQLEIDEGHSIEKYKNKKIESVRRTIELIEKLEKDEYTSIYTNEVHHEYLKYKHLIKKEKFGTSYNGTFISYQSGWVGYTGGKNSIEGYFEFEAGVLTLVDSPNEQDTTMLLNQIKLYDRDIAAAYDKAKLIKEKDIEELISLLRNHFWEWWD